MALLTTNDTKSELYEALEPSLNSHQVVLLDVPLLEQKLLGLVWRGTKIDHPSGDAAREGGARGHFLTPVTIY